MNGLAMRGAHREIAAWDSASRLNPGRGAANHMDDPRVPAAFATIGTHYENAMSNLERRVRERSSMQPG